MLTIACPGCGAVNGADDDFCGGCSRPLKRVEPNEPERRQLTVLFCDLVGSTALSQALDPEDLRTVIRAYQDCTARVIARYDGLVARFMGDGILVYFGYPRAHEDDAARAILTALELIDALTELSTRSSAAQGELKVRIGIATGLVVVG